MGTAETMDAVGVPQPSQGDMRGRLARWTLAALTAALVCALGSAAGAAKDEGGGVGAAGTAGAYSVMLLTGDRVDVAVLPGGRQAATVDPAPRGEGFPEPGFETLELEGELYVFPSDVLLDLDSTLDRELFNVTKLAELAQNSGDAPGVPVIVEYGKAAPMRQATAGPGLTGGAELSSIGAAAAVVEPDGRWWRRFVSRDPGGAARSAVADVEKIWLDQPLEVALDESAPQIDAPSAWKAGFDGTGVKVAVLDTGIDADHPDVAGKIVASANFSTEPDVSDGHGHGTHVASTVAGTGAASGGRFTGVAPGAELLIAKVCNSSGSCPTSRVIQGLEWAAAQGADVVNVSLGGSATDGSDPASQAVDALTAQYGTLFAIAAGNDGPGNRTVASPGAASSALTVGAVTKQDALASFSSRGPRLGDLAIKPDVTGPGVGIAAARAQGTSRGTPVDALYTRLSGTSMATPHAAGAAALLAQRFPDWDADELKAALVTTAVPGPLTVYQQGGGRIDVARAIGQPTVLATPAPLDFGVYTWPHDREPVTRTLTYTNLSADEVVLDLTLEVRDKDGDPAASGLLAVEPAAVTLPAGAAREVEVTLDTTVGKTSLHGGYLVAASPGGDVLLRTPLGFEKEPMLHDLRVRGIARDGRPAGGISGFDVVNVEDTSIFRETTIRFADGERTVRVPTGTYSVMGVVYTYDEPHVFVRERTFAGDPEVEVSGPTEVVLDAREGNEIVLDTPGHESAPVERVTLAYWRAAEENGTWAHIWTDSGGGEPQFAVPTGPVTLGDFEFYSRWPLGAPELVARVVEPQEIDLRTVYLLNSPRVDGRHELPMVYAGLGRPEDFEGVDAEGAAVLMRRGGDVSFTAKAQNAAAAGAAIAVIYWDVPGIARGSLTTGVIPTFSLELAQGEAVRQLIASGPVTLELRGVPVSPFLYDLVLPEPDVIRDDPSWTLPAGGLARLENAFHSDLTGRTINEARHFWRPWTITSFQVTRPTPVPLARTELLLPGDTLYRQTLWAQPSFVGEALEPQTLYEPGERREQAWFGRPARAGVAEGGPHEAGLPVVRTADALTLELPEWVDSGGHWGAMHASVDTAAFRLYRDGALVAEAPRPQGTFPLAAEPAVYRLEVDVARTAPWWTTSTETRTAWTVPSQRPPDGTTEVLPLLLVDYGVVLDLTNHAPPPGEGPNVLDLTVRHQRGAVGEPVGGLTLWVSYDDGATWKRKQVQSRGDGRFRARLDRRDVDETSGFVSLKVEAWDAGGSRVEQEVVRAYALRARD